MTETPEPAPGPDISAVITLGVPAAPGGGPSALVATPPQPYDLTVKAVTEYVAGGYWAPLGDYIRTLERWIDPNERDFGIDVYERMNTDPQVSSCREIYLAAVLGDGWRIEPAQDTPSGRGFAGKPELTSSPEAIEAADFCRDCLMRMSSGSFDEFLREMMDALYEGHKVAEIVLRHQATGQWKGDYMLDRLKVKPRESTVFVMDAYDNLVGILGILPNVPFYGMWPAFGFLAGDGLTLLPGSGRDALQRDAPALLPRSKFAVLTFDKKSNDPRGRSAYRRAFAPWWWKENAYAIWGRFISKHADPSLVGVAGEKNMSSTPSVDQNGNPITDSSGNPIMLTSVDELGQKMSVFVNGSWIAVPFGTKIDAIKIDNNGEAIDRFFETMDNQIAKALLGTTLATQESKHSSRAQAGVHQDAANEVTRYGQILLGNMVSRDILKLLVTQKYGPDSEALIPRFGLGAAETMEFKDFANAAAAIGYTAHDSQFPGMDEMGGLPPRDIAAWDKDKAEAKAAANAPAPGGDAE